MTSSPKPSQPPSTRRRVTACLVVQNERERLAEALDSVSFCDEIVVVDGGSTDGTIKIAEAAGAKVIENPWPGFAVQRNLALEHARGDWVLEIDADERVSPRLRASIERLAQVPTPSAEIAVCALRNRFLGGLLGPSAKYPAYRSRVFLRGSYRHDESRTVHEGIEPHERPLVLDGDLEHELAGTLREALLDAWRYAQLESRHLPRRRGARDYAVGIALRPVAKMAYRTVIDGGWRDGWRGLLKIALDAVSDGLVWTLALAGASRGAPLALEQPSTSEHKGHFGRRPTGPPKVVAVAGRGRSARTAARWLEGLRAAGIDVALISDDAPEESVPSQRMRRLRPVATMRALDIEMQIRTIHAVVAVGPRAKLIRLLVPATLRPEIMRLDPEDDPAAAADLVRECVERGRATRLD
ncbi:MAG: glycosyltransferase family 2 protein [Solirubrobacteraceae bacterium]